MMISINWRVRLIAAAIHFLVTLLLTGFSAALIFLVWFPGVFAQKMGGAHLFILVVFCDLVLGPLISLIIFNAKKPRKTLVIDYLVIGAVQLATLLYGLFVVASSRPVFIVFDVHRFDVVSAIELESSDLAAAKNSRYRALSWLGPELVAIEYPSDPKESGEVLFSAIKGKGAELMPKYYRPYATAIDEIKSKSKSLDDLVLKHSEKKQELDKAVKELDRASDSLRWLPVKSRFGFWTALIDAETGYPVKYLPIDPY